MKQFVRLIYFYSNSLRREVVYANSAMRYALNGLSELYREKAAKRELLLLINSILFMVVDMNYYTVSMFFINMLMLSLESINTAIEKTCNFITVDQVKEIGAIKDLAAASVMIAVLAYAILMISFLLTKLF